jgi:hypothetical protein
MISGDAWLGGNAGSVDDARDLAECSGGLDERVD